MSYHKKVMILSDVKNGEGNGIIRFTADGNHVTADLKFYNKNCGDSLVLIKADDRLLAYTTEGSSVLSLGNTNIDKAIDCLVVSGDKPVCFASTKADKYNCFNLYDEYKKQNSDKNNGEAVHAGSNRGTPAAPQKPIVKKEETERKDEEKIPHIIDETGGFSVSAESKNEKPPVLSDSVSYTGDNFYLAVKPQLDEMFICYPMETALTDLVPNSKWVRVDTEDDYYVVGIIYELDEPQYITYGIPGKRDIAPPDDIKGLCEWLPLDIGNPSGDGYWILYQNAKNGKTVNLKR